MSALQRLRQKVIRLSDGESKLDTTGDHTGTVNLTERTAWIDRIHRNGNRPRDWMELVKHMRQSTHYTNDQARQLYISNLFADALRSISAPDKKTEDYALLVIQFAQFKGQYSEDDARELYQDVRYDARKYAVSHVSAAQFELDFGNRNKAVKILEKGQSLSAQPTEMIETAFSNLVYGRSQLITDEEEKDIRRKYEADKENAPHERRHSESSDDGTAHTQPSALHAFKKPVHIHRGPENHSDTDSTAPSITVDILKRKHKSPSKKAALQSHDPNSSGYLLRIPTNEGKPETASREPGKTLRSYHSTPDCKQSSLISMSATKSSSKKATPLCRRNLGGSIGKPMRVPLKRSSLPQVVEDNKEKEHGFKLEPLRELVSETVPDIRVSRERQGSDSGIISNANSTISSNLTSLTDHLDLRDLDGIAPLDASYMLAPKPSQGSSTSSTSGDSSTLKTKLTNGANKSVIDNEKTPQPKHFEHENRTYGRTLHCQDSGISVGTASNTALDMHTPVPYFTTSQAFLPRPLIPQPSHQASQPSHSAAPSVQPASQQIPAVQGVSQPMSHPVQCVSQPMSHPVQGVSQPMSQPVQPMSHPAQPMSQTMPQPVQQPMMMSHVNMAPNSSNALVINGKCYTVLGLSGRGGSSKVYTVFDNKQLLAVKCVDLSGSDESTVESYKNEIDLLQRLQYSNCVVKLYDQSGDESTVESYKNEIDLLQRLQYSNCVVKLYDHEYCEETNMLYLVMERGDTDLSTLFKTRMKTGQITPNMLSFYWEQMLTAVQALHKEGIVHADLKPANFLLVAGNLKLIDFGIAKAIGDLTSATRDQQVGTLNYMSPEAFLDTCGGTQLDEQGQVKPRIKIGVKSDVWSLGCILYTLVYGKTPFQHIGNQFVKLQAITNPNIPIEFPPHPNQELVNVLKSCLQRSPKERPSIEELLSMSLVVQRA